MKHLIYHVTERHEREDDSTGSRKMVVMAARGASGMKCLRPTEGIQCLGCGQLGHKKVDLPNPDVANTGHVCGEMGLTREKSGREGGNSSCK